MMADVAREKYEELKKDINLHNYRYHVLDDPLISDYEFDQSLVALRDIELAHPDWITPDSPTQRSGASPADAFVKVSHPSPVLSLANAFSEQEVRDWYERILKLDDRIEETEFILEPKFDGLTVVLHYQDGVFSLGATRGDGEFGEDITGNIRTINSVPLGIPVTDSAIKIPAHLVVRAEAFISKKDFEKMNTQLESEGKKTYQNPRNTAAGSLRQLDPSAVAGRPLSIFAYAILGENSGMTQWETLAYLKNLGFPVSTLAEKCATIDEVTKRLADWEKKRNEIPYEIDGVVIKINNLHLAADLGFVGKDPRGAIAYKFPAQEVTTRLKDIRVNVGRTGVLTPYAVLEPVEVGGVVVRQATLHNFDFIEEKDIREGDRVLIKRAGDVIPYVIKPVSEMRNGSEQKYIQPKVCPVCRQPVENPAGEVAWYCVNAACPAQIIRNIEHYVSRSAMDIVGLGENIVKQLVDAGIISDFSDLYRLEKEDLLSLEGFADKKAENITEAIRTSRNQPLNRLIIGLGIRGIGEAAALSLSNRYRNLEELSNATYDEINEIEGFGPNMAQAILDWFDIQRNRKVIEKLREFQVWPEANVNSNKEPQKFKGLKFVITGTLEAFSRDEIKDFITSRGGNVSNSVSGATDYLVLGAAPGSKKAKAEALGVKVINVQELLSLADGNNS